MTRKVSLLFCLVLFPLCIFADGEPRFGFAINKYNGIYWAHRKQMLELEGPTTGLEASVYLFTQGRKPEWVKNYHFPRIGVNFNYLYLGKEITGHAFGILPFIEFHLLQGKRSELNFRMGTGVGYLTKKWDITNNIQNIAIGSHINANMRTHLIWHQSLYKNKLELNAGAGITHYSNGNIKLPNLGANSVEIMVGLGWNKFSATPSDRKYHDSGFKKNRGLEFTLASGTKQTNLIFNKQIFILTPSVKYIWHYWTKSKLAVGLDLLFDKGYYYRNGYENLPAPAVFSDYFSISVKAGHELILGDLSFISDIGAYIYSPGNFNGRIYQRVGFKYFFCKNWFGQVSLKAHFTRADFFEWGFGYYISH